MARTKQTARNDQRHEGDFWMPQINAVYATIKPYKERWLELDKEFYTAAKEDPLKIKTSIIAFSLVDLDNQKDEIDKILKEQQQGPKNTHEFWQTKFAQINMSADRIKTAIHEVQREKRKRDDHIRQEVDRIYYLEEKKEEPEELPTVSIDKPKKKNRRKKKRRYG